MNAPAASPPTRPHSEWLAGARALGASGGGAGAARVLALLYDPDVEVDAVLDCLRSEPGLAARVLKVANAPYYRQAGSVGTVDRAVQLLGLTAIRGVAASGCLDRLTPPRSGSAFDPERFRRHSQAVACAAQKLAQHAGCNCAGEAYMTGLLHDIGLLLVKVDAAAMARYTPPDSEDHTVLRAAEVAHFGTTHEACSVLLAQAWAMPEWLAQAITHHHGKQFDAQPQGTAALPALLALADHVANRAGCSLHALATPGEPSAGAASAAASLGLDESTIDEIVAALPDLLSAMQG